MSVPVEYIDHLLQFFINVQLFYTLCLMLSVTHYEASPYTIGYAADANNNNNILIVWPC